jgi:hypothetical protein
MAEMTGDGERAAGANLSYKGSFGSECVPRESFRDQEDLVTRKAEGGSGADADCAARMLHGRADMEA